MYFIKKVSSNFLLSMSNVIQKSFNEKHVAIGGSYLYENVANVERMED